MVDGLSCHSVLLETKAVRWLIRLKRQSSAMKQFSVCAESGEPHVRIELVGLSFTVQDCELRIYLSCSLSHCRLTTNVSYQTA